MSIPAFELKNNLPSLTIMKINSQDCEQISIEVRQKKKSAPMMLAGLRVILDIEAFSEQQVTTFNFAKLRKILLDEGIIPIAIMTDNTLSHKLAIDSGLGAIPYLQNDKTSPRKPSVKKPEPVPEQETESAEIKKEVPKEDEPKKTYTDNYNPESEQQQIKEASIENKIINHPIRSGQRIYSKGDLIIIGSVSPGSEVIANGNIHIYGALNGRAIAGANGDESAQIFCLDMNAELISIAGNYKQLEDINNEYFNKQTRISLNNEKICFFLL